MWMEYMENREKTVGYRYATMNAIMSTGTSDQLNKELVSSG